MLNSTIQKKTLFAICRLPVANLLLWACPFGSGFPLQSFCEKQKGFSLQSLTQIQNFRFHFCVLFFSLMFSFSSFSQQSEIDSLLPIVKFSKDDTNKINHLLRLSFAYINIGSYDTSLYYSDIALKLSSKLNYKKGYSGVYNNIGIVYFYQADYPKTLDNWLKALKIDEELGDKYGTARVLSNIGNFYLNQIDYPKALDYYLKSLKINEVLENKNGIALGLGLIGNLYLNQGEYNKALEYNLKALKISEELKNKNQIANWLCNIGGIYDEQANDTRLAPIEKERLLNLALEYDHKGLQLCEEIGAKNFTLIVLNNIGSIYTRQKKYKEAEKYILKSLALAEETSSLDDIKSCHKNLNDLFLSRGDYKNAYEEYKKFIIAKDSIFNTESSEKIANTQFKYEQEKKDKIRELEEKAKEQEHQAEVRQQKIIIWSVICGLLLVAVFSIFMFNRWRVTQKQKAIIEQQKHIVDEQKKLVEEKNKDITDSINYAQRIQRALLASESLLAPALKGEFAQDYFILFKPKDIVSGDFYWATVIASEAKQSHDEITSPLKAAARNDADRFYLAVRDSTGHGVPGAFMSLLNISFLNEAINEEEISQPNEIFNHVRQRLIQNISQDGGKDGMDGILINFSKVLNFGKVELQYSAAHNAPILIQDGKLIELDSDNMPVGMGDRKDSFTHYSINSTPPLTGEVGRGHGILYLYTDGFADQFGGPKGKKFKYKQLNDLLLANSNKTMNEQKDILEKTFEDWRGNLEQVDDVLVIGIKI